ncbi:4-hydroxy-tetrahydrodipicolinate reductase [Anaplasma capra]|uniref:4-hydroxy-tetrahydrodipicolinate reductase n=1 Tax=Anaplasma capra TaxID=1562740 RepID=UPI00295002DB|nr:4-hydroxy-tetrahydrodipicolinate reductase [Anaplasma capra]
MKIGIVGCLGRMGRLLVQEVARTDGVELSGGVVRKGSDLVGADMGEVFGCGHGAKITDSKEFLFDFSDVVIDFSSPECMLECVSIASKKCVPLVSGTTGIDEGGVCGHAKGFPFLWSCNMSFGIALLLKLAETAAASLRGYDVEIQELHHRSKKDAPSGTALMLGKAAARGMEVEFEPHQHAFGLESHGRRDSAVGFSVARGGEVVGDHAVMFLGDGDIIELKHRAIDRGIFVRGAIKAACWLVGKPAGVYTMLDVLRA